MRKRVLIIDDDLNMRRLLYSILNKDCEVYAFESGLEAIAWLDEVNTIDLILVDLEMPVMSGFELVRFIKSHIYYKKIPVVVLSGNEFSEDKIKAFRAGADDYLTKPFNPTVLKLQVENHLESKVVQV